ncbi:hypothetical protein V8D89_000198 [Ganoderma adspersum]
MWTLKYSFLWKAPRAQSNLVFTPSHSYFLCYLITEPPLFLWPGLQHFEKASDTKTDRYTLEASRLGSAAEPVNTRNDAIPRPLSIWDDPDLSSKIRDACAVARANGFDLIWIDSCCIDKTSSAELSEAINSMYAWYAGAEVCYAYLADVPPHDDHWARRSPFRRSVWFTRGWTLQELIAPFEAIILSQDWNVIGSKRDLVDLIEAITNISTEALLHEIPLHKFSVAQRLSWASRRWTTRVEDQAYSLLGMFDIHMPRMHGEGE